MSFTTERKGDLAEVREKMYHLSTSRLFALRLRGILLWGVVLVLIGLFLLLWVVGIIPLVFGILLLWGSPIVVVNTAGGDREGMQGWPWDRQPC